MMIPRDLDNHDRDKHALNGLTHYVAAKIPDTRLVL